jgi:GNAT superfamily N-acetyltransferase
LIPNRALWHSIGHAISAFFGEIPGTETRFYESGWSVCTGEPVVDFNCASVYGTESAAQALEQIAQVFADRQVPFMLSMAEEVARQLEDQAKRLGLRNAGGASLMCLKSASLEPGEAPPGLTVHRADESCLVEFADLASTIFSLPRDSVAKVFVPSLLAKDQLALYLARSNGAPAGVTILSLDGDKVGVWCMGTAPNFRRRGIGRALLLAAMEKHHTADTTFFLTPTPEGRKLYEKVGFRDVTRGQAWTNLPIS